MSYHQQQGGPEAGGRRQQAPYPLLGTNGGATGARAPTAGVYGIPQYGQVAQTEVYGGPPPSPVVAGSWDRAWLDEGYMRQEPQGILPGTGTPLGSATSGSGDAGFLVSGGANAMGAPMQSYYPPSLYGVPASVYPFQPAGFPGPYAGAGGAGTAGSAGAGATAAANFYGQGGYPRSTNPGQPIQTTTNLQGPDGCNLFVFHIPNTMTNDALFRLFSKFGNVISARIMVEKATGRSRGFGFVSYDHRDSAEKAISQMNGYQIEHKRLKVQHKKDKDRERFSAAPSPTQRMMGAAGGVVVPNRVQQATHFRQPLLPQHTALRHHSVGDDKPPPPSPAAENGSFTGHNTDGDLTDNQTSVNEGGIDGADPGYSSRATAGDKYGRQNDHPHMAYIYRARGTTQPTDDGGPVDDEGEPYMAPSATVGNSRRAGSPDPKMAGTRPTSASPGAPATSAAAVSAVAGAGTMSHPSLDQSLEHAMQTQLSLGGNGNAPASAQPS